ncbi:MAG: molybdopterin-dependent oxidoreductase [Planctomycetes bacterium]|nr:molybdopterin-dependent oxidoreductase [Planctomycetota bacterium]
MTEPDEKFIKAKQNIAEKGIAEGKGTGMFPVSRDRLPPGQKLVTANWPVLDLGLRPDLKREDFKLEISGAAEAQTFDWDSFNALPQIKQTTDLHCVTTWSIYDAEVEGVLWAEFLRHIKVHEDATHVMFSAHDGYTTNLPMSELAMPNVAIVHSFGGKPLTREHGGPVRMWVPHLYAWKGAKWLKGIEFLTEDRKGFWEVRGYHNHGDPWKEERYS